MFGQIVRGRVTGNWYEYADKEVEHGRLWGQSQKTPDLTRL